MRKFSIMVSKCGECPYGDPQMEFTDDDVVRCWPHHIAYVVDILNGEYALDDARNDLRSLVGSKHDPRILPVKVSDDADADEMNSTHGEGYGIDWEYSAATQKDEVNK